MAILLLGHDNIEQFINRIHSIKSDSKPKWGELTPTKLMSHLRFLFEMSLGEVDATDKSNIITRTVLRYVFFHIITHWPGGKIKAPPHFTPKAEGNFDEEKSKLIDIMRRFVETAEKEPKRMTVSEMMGPLPLEYWRRVHGVHMNHHFRQYGV